MLSIKNASYIIIDVFYKYFNKYITKIEIQYIELIKTTEKCGECG